MKEEGERVKGKGEGTENLSPFPLPLSPLLEPLTRLKLVKVCNDAGDAVPEGCGRVLPDGGE